MSTGGVLNRLLRRARSSSNVPNATNDPALFPTTLIQKVQSGLKEAEKRNPHLENGACYRITPPSTGNEDQSVDNPLVLPLLEPNQPELLVLVPARTSQKVLRAYILLENKKLGKGNYARLIQVFDISTYEKFACKKIPRSSTALEIAETNNEIEILKILKRFRDRCTLPGSDGQEIDHLLMPHFPGVNLDQFLTLYRQELDIAKKSTLCLGAARALLGLHGEGILWRDAKPANYIVDSKSRLNLTAIDFGSSISIDKIHTKVNALTPGYADPELFQQEQPYKVLHDFFSLGVVLIRILANESFKTNLDAAVAELSPFNYNLTGADIIALAPELFNPSSNSTQALKPAEAELQDKLVALIKHLLAPSANRANKADIERQLSQIENQLERVLQGDNTTEQGDPTTLQLSKSFKLRRNSKPNALSNSDRLPLTSSQTSISSTSTTCSPRSSTAPASRRSSISTPRALPEEDEPILNIDIMPRGTSSTSASSTSASASSSVSSPRKNNDVVRLASHPSSTYSDEERLLADLTTALDKVELSGDSETLSTSPTAFLVSAERGLNDTSPLQDASTRQHHSRHPSQRVVSKSAKHKRAK